MALVASGILDQRITISQLTVARGALGGHDETWARYATVWAQMQDMTGREIFQAKAMGSAATKLFTIRYLAGVKPAMQVVAPDGTVCRIEWIRQVTRKEYLELYCLVLDDD